ncbi:Monocarboxylate transporter 14 [Orchesella cincta]|uniref:Monocarboxylate transporter 14 n=1 Tax=Orchesella cincta TaxID=48709 RepID=A0A1D2MKU3_ORCCI|nr:Monocarboxylate transporter 14 [Orchesella cincta]
MSKDEPIDGPIIVERHHHPRMSIVSTGTATGPLRTSISSQTKRASFFIGDNEGNRVPVKIVGPDEQEITADEIIVPPDGGYGYVIVFAAFLSNVIVDGIVFSFGSLKDSIHEAGGGTLDQSTVAWIGSLLTGFYLLTGPFVSAIANKWGFRSVAVMGSLIASSAFILSWYLCQDGPRIGLLILFYGVIGGSGFGMIYVPAVIAVGFYFEKKRALATGIAICGSGIGNFIFPPFIQFLNQRYGWQKSIFVLGLTVLLCGLLGLLYRPLKPQRVRKLSLITPLESPEGTPLLMRIKRARDVMMKWDSINSFVSNRESYPEVQNADPRNRAEVLYNRARKSSTASLKGNVPVGMPVSGMQKKRLSVPSMLGGEPPNFPYATGALTSVPSKATSLKAKSFVGLPDLHEIEEEHGSDDAGSREASVGPAPLAIEPVKSKTGDGIDDNENSNLIRNRNGSVVTCRIGNSMLMVDEMTNSRILRVASRVTLNKPLYRDDIFYSGSLLRIPDYANNVMTSQEWTAAVTRPPENEILPIVEAEDKPKSTCLGGSCDIVKKMLDFSLLRSPTFIIFSISGMFSMLGLFVPFVFLMDQAYSVLKDDIDDKQALTLLISLIGAANTVGRILAGWIADRPFINALMLNNGAVTIMGLSTLMVPHLSTFGQFIAYSCTFGISMACFASLRSILVVELLGLAKLTNAFGLLLLFQGIASMVATPLAGIIAQQSGGDFAMAFYAAGSFLVFSAVMLYPLNRLNKWEKSRKKDEDMQKA